MGFAVLCAEDWQEYLTLRGASFDWPWLGLIVAAALLCVGIGARHGAKKGQADSKGAMDVWTLDDDMSGALVDSRYHRWVAAGKTSVIVMAALGLVAAALAARPVAIRTDNESATKRDIVLCLDASGSTLPYDAQIVDTYLSLVDHFHGERIGLSIFNSSSRTVFPLTDDYDLVKDQLTKASDVLKPLATYDIRGLTDQEYEALDNWLAGTTNVDDAASLIGDGLVSCAIMLPEFVLNSSRNLTASQNGQGDGDVRSGMILLATDNEVNGEQIYTLSEALDLTDESNIAVDALYAGATPQGTEAREMSSLISSHGGIYESTSSSDAVSNLVRDIDSRSQGREEDTDRADRRDTPGVLVLAFVILWAIYILIEGALRR